MTVSSGLVINEQYAWVIKWETLFIWDTDGETIYFCLQDYSATINPRNCNDSRIYTLFPSFVFNS